MVHPSPPAAPIKTEDEDRVVGEFCHLLEKSKQLFNGLRDLPPYGHKQWQAYFGRAFDIYTKLWKFQQQHRVILDKKYGLKRWQIGEIASKIGQLYYHYYLRTSETNYLNEAFQFYGAIRARGYYSKKEERNDMIQIPDFKDQDPAHHDTNFCYRRLIIKKLRYFARFIVVCFLLKKIKTVVELVKELSTHIDDYTASYEPEDQLEWSLVLSEIRVFIEADSPIKVIDSEGGVVTITHRLTPLGIPPIEKTGSMKLELQEILIIGSKGEQIKFSELTIDMFRILQTFEREPIEPIDESTANNPCCKRENPHKHLLYKPTIMTVLVYLSSGWKDLEFNGVLLVYLSGDPSWVNSEKLGEEDIKPVPGYDSGGVCVSTSKPNEEFNRRNFMLNETHCLYPGDLLTFTRKPLFLIIDSENSNSFQDMINPFGQPSVILMSPVQVPTFIQENQRGSLFTLFLHSPLSAFLIICGINDLVFNLWEGGLPFIDRFMAEASRIVVRSRNQDDPYIQFFGDDFLRLIILRYLFCGTVLRLNRNFQSRSNQPSSQPPLEIESGNLDQIVLELAENFGVTSHFF